MNRPKLFAIAKKAGWKPDKPLPTAKRAAIEAALRAYFASPEGRQALEDAPRQHHIDRGTDKHRRMDAEDAARALLEELEAT